MDTLMIRSIISNCRPRLRLLKTVLTKRFIWNELTDMVKEQGYEIREICANVQPLRFAVDLFDGCTPSPEFQKTLGEVEQFDGYDLFPWSSERSVSEFLGDLVFRHRAKQVVEVGCFVGWSSAHIALGLKAADSGGRLWCIDYDRNILEIARGNLAKRSLDEGTTFICGLSLDSSVLSALPAEIDVIFLDTSHEYEDTIREVEAYLCRLSHNGYLVLHDSISANGVRRAIQQLYGAFHSLTFATEYGNGVTVLQKI
jgi:predicted O-methyltransferase YrrM